MSEFPTLTRAVGTSFYARCPREGRRSEHTARPYGRAHQKCGKAPGASGARLPREGRLSVGHRPWTPLPEPRRDGA